MPQPWCGHVWWCNRWNETDLCLATSRSSEHETGHLSYLQDLKVLAGSGETSYLLRFVSENRESLYVNFFHIHIISVNSQWFWQPRMRYQLGVERQWSTLTPSKWNCWCRLQFATTLAAFVGALAVIATCHCVFIPTHFCSTVKISISGSTWCCIKACVGP